MEYSTISPKFQVVIPKKIRRILGLHPGQKIQVLMYENRVELIPARDIREARGFLRGIDTKIVRDEDRE